MWSRRSPTAATTIFAGALEGPEAGAGLGAGGDGAAQAARRRARAR
jgi:hypothetical protein